ncbi:small-conductance mechanosensitive channel [Salinisphaera sp. PC39]
MLLLAAAVAACVLALLLVGERPESSSAWPWERLAASGALVLAALLASRLIGWLVAGLHEGRFAWQRRLRRQLGVEKGERLHEAGWIAAILYLVLWAGLPLVILHVWGLTEQSLALLSTFGRGGFNVGQVQIVPGRLVAGVLVFAALVIGVRWLAGRLERRWLANTPMEAHTRETVATLCGYVGFVLAGLAGLSYAGFDLTNLALVAGALSVGIGFGLQNIVNNFVSGLILLFERPIRTGDYISVGSTEGFVRRLRIRSTEIETWDGISVVVPNSELIANHVTNWMLRDRHGRVTVSVGVAYGSDTQLVKRLLLEAAEAHPQVVVDEHGSTPLPIVFFAGFGDSSLDFQLKAFVTDIARRYRVASDLNFAIDAAFREHGVTIPFPQRDLWFRNPAPSAAGDRATGSPMPGEGED